MVTVFHVFSTVVTFVTTPDDGAVLANWEQLNAEGAIVAPLAVQPDHVEFSTPATINVFVNVPVANVVQSGAKTPVGPGVGPITAPTIGKLSILVTPPVQITARTLVTI
jgi:hypothetical protein